MKNISYDLLQLLISHEKELGLPSTILLDYLNDVGDALSLETTPSPKLEEEYIDGSQIYGYSFEILAATDGGRNSEPNEKAIEWLESIGAFFDSMEDYPLSENRMIHAAELMSPALFFKTQDGRIIYSISIRIIYEEA